MRIAIDANPMFLTRSGIGNYTYHLVRQLVRIDPVNEYYLYNTVTKDRTLEGLQLGENAKVVCFPKMFSSWQSRKDRIDVYHGTSYQLRAQGRSGSVVTIHDLALVKFPEFSKKLLGERWSKYKTRKTLERSTRVIAVSQSTADDICAVYKIPMEKIRVIYNGVGEEFFAAPDSAMIKSIRLKFGIPPGDYILYVGGSDPRKNLQRLLQALSIVNKSREPIRLIVTGGMSRRAKEIHEGISILGLQNVVTITEHISVHDLCSLYWGSRLFVYPSLYEGFGIPILEAMACGVPVITSKSSSLPEVAGEAAYFVDPYDVPEIAAAIQAILEDKNLASALCAKGMERVKEFSWEKAARQTLKVYEECLN